MTLAGETGRWVMLALKADNLSSIPGTHTMKDRTDSHKLSFDLHMDAAPNNKEKEGRGY